MFFTQVLCIKKIKWIPAKLPRGNIWRGKYRLVRKVNAEDIAWGKIALDVEEKNMFYLRHPYVTAKEYESGGKDFLNLYGKMLMEHRDRQMKNFRKTIEPRKIESFLRLRFGRNNRWE